jgi:signal transduction histidine kinase
LSFYGNEQVLELQSSARTFFARLNTAAGRVQDMPVGSRLAVTGVYVVNQDKLDGRADAGPFELLLNTPADVQVLGLPSWWTSQHALIVVSGLTLVIVLSLVWIAMLRHQVGWRTSELFAANRSLTDQIAERKRAENELVRARLQHLVEQERTRIARDIHDELGCSLSQIRLLSEMTLSPNRQLADLESNATKILPRRSKRRGSWMKSCGQWTRRTTRWRAC